MIALASSVAVNHEHFKKLLADRGLRETDVASHIGVHKNTVSNWATGRTQVVPQRVQDLAALLGTSIDELIDPTAPSSIPRETSLRRASAERDEAGRQAVEVLRQLLGSAGALRSLSQAAPSLMDVLRDAEEAVERYGGPAAERGPRRT